MHAFTMQEGWPRNELCVIDQHVRFLQVSTPGVEDAHQYVLAQAQEVATLSGRLNSKITAEVSTVDYQEANVLLCANDLKLNGCTSSAKLWRECHL